MSVVQVQNSWRIKAALTTTAALSSTNFVFSDNGTNNRSDSSITDSTTAPDTKSKQLDSALVQWLANPVCTPSKEEFERSVRGINNNSEIVPALLQIELDRMQIPPQKQELVITSESLNLKGIKVRIPDSYPVYFCSEFLTSKPVGRIETEAPFRVIFPEPIPLEIKHAPTDRYDHKLSCELLRKNENLIIRPDGRVTYDNTAGSFVSVYYHVAVQESDAVFVNNQIRLLRDEAPFQILATRNRDLLGAATRQDWCASVARSTYFSSDSADNNAGAYAALIEEKLAKNERVSLDIYTDKKISNPALFTAAEFQTLKTQGERLGFDIGRVGPSGVRNQKILQVMYASAITLVIASIGGLLIIGKKIGSTLKHPQKN